MPPYLFVQVLKGKQLSAAETPAAGPLRASHMDLSRWIRNLIWISFLYFTCEFDGDPPKCAQKPA